MVKAEIKKLKKSQVEISVTVEWEHWKKFIAQAVEEISKDIKIEGFRSGKAPREMVEKKVGTFAILDAAAQKAVQKTYPQALADNKIEAIGAPKAEIKKLAENNPLEYVVVTAVIPEITLKPWKKDVKKVAEEYAKKKVEVSAEEVEKELEQLANSRVQLVNAEREAKDGDSVLVDFEVMRDGVVIEHGTGKDHPLVLGKGVFIPGFEENVIGMKQGEEKTFELEFPKEYHEKTLAGKPASFHVTLKLVQERRTPEISDEFAKSLGKFKDLADLRKNIKEGISEEKKHQQKEEMRAKMIEALLKNAEAEIPEVLLKEEVRKMIGEFEMQLSGMGMDLDKYFEHTKKTHEDMQKEWLPQAEKRIMASLALEQVVKEEEIQIPSEEIEAEMNRMLAQYRDIENVKKNIDMEKVYTYVKGTLQNEKVFELMEKVK